MTVCFFETLSFCALLSLPGSLSLVLLMTIILVHGVVFATLGLSIERLFLPRVKFSLSLYDFRFAIGSFHPMEGRIDPLRKVVEVDRRGDRSLFGLALVR